MHARATAKHPDVQFEHVGLQEFAFEEEFDAAMCVDAMEHVPPDDWPHVLGNLRQALRSGGYLYLTVEEVDRRELDRVFAETKDAGLHTVHGEDVSADSGEYHYYPDREHVRRWLVDAGFALVDEADEGFDGCSHHHLLVQTEEG